MIKLLLFIITLIAGEISLSGQVNVLDASTIPGPLKIDAHSIVRESKMDFEVRSAHEARLTAHIVLSALDVAGEPDLVFVEYADKFRSLADAEIRVYNGQGILQKKYKKKDFQMESPSSGLAEDATYYSLKVSSPGFPMTVVYDYEIQYSGTLNYPDFDIQDPGQSVEFSSYTAKIPIGLDLKYKAKNINLSPAITTEANMKVFKWEVKNLPSIQKEDGAVSYESRYPRILISPTKFDMDGNAGDFTTWKSFGEWYTNLLQGTSNLSEERKLFFQDLVKNTPNVKDKIRLVYNYLQTNFRYVSIQLGIGGYKPFTADFVDKKKYGDCKALSNYTCACLAAIGIKSYPALINAVYNKEPVDPNFPHNSFNHMILCVPMLKDTVWLECTSKSEDCGVLGSFTENRNALLITENGGILVSTPKSTSKGNSLNIRTLVKFIEDGSGESNSEISSTGEYKQDMIGYLKDEKKDVQKTYLINNLGFPQPDEFDLKLKDETYSQTSLKLVLEKVPAFSAGSKMFLNPRIYKIWAYSLPLYEKRKQDFYFKYPFQKTDTTVYHLPEGFSVETLPASKSFKFEFGSFESKYQYDEKEKTITTYAQLILSQHKIPFEKYQETRKFFGNVLDEFNDKIVVKKNN